MNRNGSQERTEFTLAALLNQWAGWSATLSLFTAGVLGLLLAAGSVLLGWQLTCKALSTFDRSKTEFRNNLVWLKTTLEHPSHDVANANESNKPDEERSNLACLSQRPSTTSDNVTPRSQRTRT